VLVYSEHAGENLVIGSGVVLVQVSVDSNWSAGLNERLVVVVYADLPGFVTPEGDPCRALRVHGVFGPVSPWFSRALPPAEELGLAADDPDYGAKVVKGVRRIIVRDPVGVDSFDITNIDTVDAIDNAVAEAYCRANDPAYEVFGAERNSYVVELVSGKGIDLSGYLEARVFLEVLDKVLRVRVEFARDLDVVTILLQSYLNGDNSRALVSNLYWARYGRVDDGH